MNQQQSQIETIIGDHESFLDKIFKNLEEVRIDSGEFKELDHVAYRVETLERYEELKSKLMEFSLAHSEVEISGRSILVLKLKEPLKYRQWEIGCLELPAPRTGTHFQEGLEHAEFIINVTLPEFLEKHKNIAFNMKEYEREINPALIIDFADCAVKFHEQSLLNIRNM